MSDPIDFRRSLPPIAPSLHSELARTLSELGKRQDLAALIHESAPDADDATRLTGARYLECRLGELFPERVIAINSTQSALFLLLRELVDPAGVLLTESITYGALRPVVQKTSVRALGVAIDSEGIIPHAFEEACRMHRPRALYVNPTLHNPTTAIMSLPRRREVVAIARRYDVLIIEDEALGWLRPDAPPPLAALAPEQCWYIMSTTKRLSHGLRLTYAAAPSAHAAAQFLESARSLSFWIPSPLVTGVLQHWMESGVVERISGEIAAECLRRESVANEVLAGLDVRAPLGTMHIWISLPAHYNADEFAAVAQTRGVLLRPASHFLAAPGVAPNAVRLSLSTPPSIANMRSGLELVRELLGGGSGNGPGAGFSS